MLRAKYALCCAAVLLLVVAGCAKRESAAKPKPAAAAAAPGVEVGQTMPAYSAKLLDGKPFDLAGEKGNVVFLNVWATWCGPCRFEIPELQKLHDKFAGRRFKVIGVSVDEGDGADVRKFVADQKMSYPVAFDPEAKIANLLQTSVLPTSVILDRNGKIVWKKFGLVDTADGEMNGELEKALAQ